MSIESPPWWARRILIGSIRRRVHPLHHDILLFQFGLLIFPPGVAAREQRVGVDGHGGGGELLGLGRVRESALDQGHEGAQGDVCPGASPSVKFGRF